MNYLRFDCFAGCQNMVCVLRTLKGIRYGYSIGTGRVMSFLLIYFYSIGSNADRLLCYIYGYSCFLFNICCLFEACHDINLLLKLILKIKQNFQIIMYNLNFFYKMYKIRRNFLTYKIFKKCKLYLISVIIYLFIKKRSNKENVFYN